jgi:putative tryptophan/tyrosine transport system substrate-binding protein
MMMVRAAFAVVLALTVLAAPLIAEAQPTGKVPRVGVLSAGSSTDLQTYLDAFRQTLRELGSVEGRSVAFEYRWAEGK